MLNRKIEKLCFEALFETRIKTQISLSYRNLTTRSPQIIFYGNKDESRFCHWLSAMAYSQAIPTATQRLTPTSARGT